MKNKTNVLLLTILLVSILYTLINIFSIYKVHGGSMSPALNDGDIIITINTHFIKTYRKMTNSYNDSFIFNNGDIVVVSVPTVFSEEIVSFTKMFKRINNSFYKNHSDRFSLIPKKNDHIMINPGNQNLKNLIICDTYKSSGNITSIINDHSTYTFKNNFYFFVGDNIDNSMDSREFGPLPETFISGKVIFTFNLSHLAKNTYSSFSL